MGLGSWDLGPASKDPSVGASASVKVSRLSLNQASPSEWDPDMGIWRLCLSTKGPSMSSFYSSLEWVSRCHARPLGNYAWEGMGPRDLGPDLFRLGY
ncbi:uncharacterized protein J3R85_006997 [Psidium guajava]|nr:uncharacterized protein J3R85_006997 [Psidium guajava]